MGFLDEIGNQIGSGFGSEGGGFRGDFDRFFGGRSDSLFGGSSDFLPGAFDLKGEIVGQGSEQIPTLTPGQLQLLNQLTGFVSGQIGQPGRVPGAELGPVGPSDLQSQAFGLAGQLPQQFDPNAISSAMAPVGQFAQNQFREETIPDIMSALGGIGAARSSGAAEVLGRKGRDLNLGLAAQFGPMQFQAQQAHMARQAQVPGQIANLGAVQRGIGAEQQQFDLDRFMAADPSRNQALGLLPQTLGTSAFDTAVFQGFRQPHFLEATAGGIGGAVGGMMASDERVKENIVPIEDALEKLDKLEGKTFNYKINKEPNGGLIAQDIEKVLPQAVVEIGGVKYVNYYAVLGLLVNAVKELKSELDRKAG